jgi:hypothetical protein
MGTGQGVQLEGGTKLLTQVSPSVVLFGGCGAGKGFLIRKSHNSGKGLSLSGAIGWYGKRNPIDGNDTSYKELSTSTVPVVGYE